MHQDEHNNSMLAADFGSVNTRVVMIDLVDGQFRLVTRARVRTTMDSPLGSVRVGLERAISNIEQVTDRQIIDVNELIIPETPDGQGVDKFLATSSAGRPLQAIILGIMPAISISSARRALTGTYINVAATISAADQQDLETCINIILTAQPDILFVAGGTDGGNQQAVMHLIRIVDVAVKLFPPDQRPAIVFAGNQQLADTVENYLIDANATILVSQNVRPSPLHEELGDAQLHLAQAYSNYVSRQPGGFHDIAEMSKGSIIPTAQSITSIVRWMGESTEDDTGVLHLDIGSSTSTLILSQFGKVTSNIHSDLGLGHSLVSTLERINIEQLLSWLPFELEEEQLHTYAHNKVLAPDTIPHLQEDLLLEQAFAREIARLMVHEYREGLSRSIDLDMAGFSRIIAAGAVFSDTQHPGLTALLILDALEIEGVVELLTDPYSILPALGALAYVNPIATVQTLENNALMLLGTAFCASGRARQGARAAMRIRIRLDNGREFEKRLTTGEVWAAPVAPGHRAEVEVRLGRGLTIDGRRQIRQQVTTGTAGIIFDTRGRPLQFIPLRRRAEVLSTWWRAITNNKVAAYTAVPEKEEKETISHRQRQQEIEELQSLILLSAAEDDENFGEPDFEELETGRQRRRRDKQTDQPKPAGKKQRRRRRRKDDEPEEPDWDDLLDQF